jgi:thioredoxin-like negative regulator of GroEL
MRRLVLVGISAALLAAAVLLFLRPNPAPSPELRLMLPRLDAAISGGSLSTAKEILASVQSVPAGELDQLSLLKRAFQVGRETGDFSVLSDLSTRALALNGRSEQVRAVAAYAALRSGRVSDGQKILGRSPAAGSGGELLKGEAVLRGGSVWKGSDGLTRDLIALEESQSPAAFAAAAVRTGERRLTLDAALLAMRQGSPDAALRLVRDLDDARFDEPVGLMLYDGGDFTAAVSRLERRDHEKPGIAATGLVLADIFAAAANSAQSERWLFKTLQAAPSLSWTPYANLSLFAAQRGDMAAAGRQLDDGLAFFPRSRELRFMKARVDILAGDHRAAESILGEVLADRPSDSEAALLLLGLQSAEMSPEAVRARLWNLFNLAPSDPSVFDTLASSLIAAQDWEGMQIAMKQHQASGGQPDARALLLQGLAAAMQADDALATAAFRRSALLAKDGMARFNLALVLLRRGAARAALAELDGAAEEVQETAPPGGRARLLSRVETMRGAARLLDGDIPGAGSALSRARALDPRNLRAGLLLRKLEAGGQ